MKRIIKWNSQHLDIDVLSGKLKEADKEDDIFDKFDDLDYDDDEGGPQVISNVMSTPFGFWRVDDSMHPYKQFKLWMAHTNFSITRRVVATIKKVPGVEVLQVISRYRFIMGVGELFTMRDVRHTIEKALVCNQDESDMIGNPKILEQVHQLRDSLSSYDEWAIYIFPNGNIDFSTSENPNFVQQRNVYRQAVDYSNGVLLESDNE
jgi:hypothetical protein